MISNSHRPPCWLCCPSMTSVHDAKICVLLLSGTHEWIFLESHPYLTNKGGYVASVIIRKYFWTDTSLDRNLTWIPKLRIMWIYPVRPWHGAFGVSIFSNMLVRIFVYENLLQFVVFFNITPMNGIKNRTNNFDSSSFYQKTENVRPWQTDQAL